MTRWKERLCLVRVLQKSSSRVRFQPDTSAADLGTKISVQWFVQSVVLTAKAAADPGLDHLDLPPGKAKRLRDDPPQHVGHLGAGYNDELLVLHIGVRDGVSPCDSA